MALIKFSSMVSDARKSNGGVVFSRNLGGAYTRARTTPLNPRTAAQTLVRNNFATVTKAWGTALGASDRGAWTIFAQNFPLVNILGASIVVSGLAMFTKLSQVLLQIGASLQIDPPVDLSVPALATVTGFTVNSTGPVLQVTTGAQAVTAGAKYYIFATPPLSAGKTPQKSEFRFIGAYAAVAAAVHVDISAAYQDLFSAYALAPGSIVGALVATVNTDSGAVTPGLRFTAIAT